MADTDGDGISDGQEALDGTDPNDSCDSVGGTPLGTDDCDNDGLTNDEETTGVDDPSTPANPNEETTDPNVADTDGDGISDGQEALDGTDPNDSCDSVSGTPLGTGDCDNDEETGGEEEENGTEEEGLEDLENEFENYIYPIPAENIIYVNNLELGENIKIYTLLGQLVLNENYKGNIDVSFLGKGFYFITFKINSKTHFVKWLKN